MKIFRPERPIDYPQSQDLDYVHQSKWDAIAAWSIAIALAAAVVVPLAIVLVWSL